MAQGADGFYRQRDDLVGGQDTPWNVPAADFDQGGEFSTGSVDMRRGGAGQPDFSGVLSQSALAGSDDYTNFDPTIYGS